MNDQNPGANPPSGKTPKTDWKGRSKELEQRVWELELELKAAQEKYEALEKGHLKPRELTKLQTLEHFYGRVLNAQVNKEARAHLDKICEEVSYVLGKKSP